MEGRLIERWASLCAVLESAAVPVPKDTDRSSTDQGEGEAEEELDPEALRRFLASEPTPS